MFFNQKNIYMDYIDFLCQIEISYFECKFFFNPDFFIDSAFSRFFKHKLLILKLFWDSKFLATLVVHSYIYIYTII